MTPQEAEKAFAKRQIVARFRPGYPRQPYVGLLISKFKDGRYGFDGKSGTTFFEGIVNPDEIFIPSPRFVDTSNI